MFYAKSFSRYTVAPYATESEAIDRAKQIARTTCVPANVFAGEVEIAVVFSDGEVRYR